MVSLSGGDLGGTQIDGVDWDVGQLKEISGLLYRRIDEIQAVYVGPAA